MRNFIHLLFVIALVGFSFANTSSAQTQDRIMIFENTCDKPAAESDDEDNRCLVELVDVRIGDQKITSEKSFVADENWMKNLKVRIKNVSGKPFVFASVDFGLIEGLYEKPAPTASWSSGFIFSRGKESDPFNGNIKISDEVVLEPNKEIELTFDDLPSFYRDLTTLETLGKMSQIVLTTAAVEFKDGKQKDSFLFIKRQK